MKLRCIKPMSAYWGDILIVDKEYKVNEIKMVPTEFITDHDNYWKYLTKISSSMEWIRKGYKQETLGEVIPGYLTLSEVNKRYTKKVDMPFAIIECSDNQKKRFCLLSDKEVYALGADVNNNRNEERPAFSYTVYMVDDYFDYVKTRRDNILNKLGIS